MAAGLTGKKGLKFFGVVKVTRQMLEKRRLRFLEKNDSLVTTGKRPNTLFRFQPR
jgi:hypothetical protein